MQVDAGPTREAAQFEIPPLSYEGLGFDNLHLRQHPPGPFACDFGQGIIDSLRPTEQNDGGISRHGVSLLREVPGGSTPASIRRLQSNVVTQIPA
jgi:hypothetical protein